MDRCVNCRIATNRCNTTDRRDLDDEMILAVIRQWRTPQSVSTYSLLVYLTNVYHAGLQSLQYFFLHHYTNKIIIKNKRSVGRFRGNILISSSTITTLGTMSYMYV